ncbi:MAG: RluA family pseudouridine synthase [Nitrospirota bacterium]|nr:RluA family pseudouridine synthase [Nitrospirota bacterium]
MPYTTFTVTESHRGKRLDLFIQHHDAHISRNRIQAMLADGLALVNGKPEKPGYKVKPGDVITLELPERIIREVLPENIPLHVVYEDDAMVVLNKPAGLVVHPAPGNYTGTLVNALLFHYGSLPAALGSGPDDEEGEGGRERAGIVHRLDKDTSGIMVVARTPEVLRTLSAQFKARIVQKKYLALVAGVIKKGSGTIEAAIGRHVKERKKISVHTASPREAITLFRVMERYRIATLVEVEIKTGRTHQIRVHMSHLGHPVLGDRTYGNDRLLKIGDLMIDRQMLHAESLSLRHPISGHPMTFSAPPPADMQAVINALRVMSRDRSRSGNEQE